MIKIAYPLEAFKRFFAVLITATLLISSLPVMALADSTGITVAPADLTMPVGVQANFKITTEFSGTSTTAGTYISVNDDGTGSFFGSDGGCDNSTPDSDNLFDIDKTRNVCYSNNTAGNHTIRVQLLTAKGGSPIGSPLNITVTVTEPVIVTPAATTGDVVITKVVSGGTATVADFQLKVGEILVTSGEVKTGVATGTYMVTETGSTTDYTASFGGDCSATGELLVVAGEQVECTITNTFVTATTTPDIDTDGDGILDGADNCPTVANVDQVDTDEDRIGNACEVVPVVRVCENGSNLLANGSFETPVITRDWTILSSVTNWLISLSDGLELWHNFMGVASEGQQNAELDGNSPTKITQSVATIPGATYELKFDFSARPGTTAANNSMDAMVGNTVLMNVTADGSAQSTTTWSTHRKTFVAATTTSDISFVDIGTADSHGSLIDNAVLCFVSNPPAPVCEPELSGSWADEIISFTQGPRRGGALVAGNRSDETNTIGVADWVFREEGDFLSLGFGGKIVLAFGSFIPDVAGNDITVYEATNGAFPAETALVEVSQNNSTWYPIGTAGNVPSASSFDFASTGLSWVKYVRITDTTNRALHANDADGFDVDAVFVAKTVCTQPANPEEPVDPDPTCKLTIVSDTTNTVVEREDAFAKLITYPWTAVINLANWIWADETVQSPTVIEAYTFEKSFVWNGPVTSAVFDIAADNSYEVTLNGTVIGSSTAENNYALTTQDEYTNFSSAVVSGNNTLAVKVKNWALGNSTASTNPAGVLYNLTILDTESAECTEDGPGSSEELYRLEGFVWHDDNKNQEWEGHGELLEQLPAELPLHSWVVRATNGSTSTSTITDSEGYYKFDVPAGTWTITEEVITGWERVTQESYIVTVPAERTEASVLDMIREYIVPTAHAVTIPTFGDYNFGNDTIDSTVTTDTDNGGSNRSGGGSGTRVLSRVAGDSLSVVEPTPRVLGEQVSVVPTGAPGTGHGGTAPTTAVPSLAQLLVSPRRMQIVK